jgi:prefoldin alpha subunit
MANEELIMKLSMLQQQAEKLEEQINLVNQQISELEELKLGLEEIREGEILANIGKGIFIKAEVKSRELYVNVGDKKIVKKDVRGTKELVDKQIVKMQELKSNLLDEIQKVNKELHGLIISAKQSHE